MAAGGSNNTPAFRRLHHPRILHMCSTTPGGGGHYWRNCLLQSVWLPFWIILSPYIWPVCFFFPLCFSVCSHSGPSILSPCMSFCLTAHYCCTIRGHGSFISAALCRYVAASYKRPLWCFIWGHSMRQRKTLKQLPVGQVTWLCIKDIQQAIFMEKKKMQNSYCPSTLAVKRINCCLFVFLFFFKGLSSWMQLQIRASCNASKAIAACSRITTWFLPKFDDIISHKFKVSAGWLSYSA